MRLKQKLMERCEGWEQQARNQFEAAKHEENELGRKALEYGAMICSNHASQLRGILDTQFMPRLLLEILKKKTK